MNRYEKIARKAINCYMRRKSHKANIPLFRLAAVANTAVRAAGKKQKLYAGLLAYEKLLPAGAEVLWRPGRWRPGSGFHFVINPYYRLDKLEVDFTEPFTKEICHI